MRTRKQVMLGPDCNVTLCIACYKPFYTVENLEKIKADFKHNELVMPTSTSEVSLSSIQIISKV